MAEEQNTPPQIAARYELAPGQAMALGLESTQYEPGGGVLKYSDGTFKLQLTLRSHGTRSIVDTETTPLAGKGLSQTLTKLGIDQNFQKLPPTPAFQSK